MPTNIETLKKITYENLEQFVEDVNRNFAIVENSPLHKGVPGKEGDDGTPGIRGIRGIKFLFVDYNKFNLIFPGELSVPSKIDLNFINSKVSNFETRQKLFEALNVTEFVDKDVLVLTNSVMLSYNGNNEYFNDTGMAFNPESNLLSNINKIIENYVTYYIDNNPILNGLVNVFQIYQTYAKNYADNNNGFITNELTESSVYSPHIPGFNNTVGINIDNHKYYGYNDLEFPITNKGTFVFGSIKRYYQLLMNTISTAGNETLSSDYAPGAGNIPTAVFLQDTYKNGIYIGHKDKTNLKRFGTIYKNEENDFVIKSDSSMIESEYSELLINRSYLRFKKLVQFFDSLEVSRDLTVSSDISNKHIRTGKFTKNASTANTFNTNKSEFGAVGAGTVKINSSEFDEYIHYLDRVLVTNPTGRVMKEYAIEKIAMNNTQLIDLTQITGIPTNQYNVLTSNYFGFLANKINNVTAYVTANYWRKNQFNTGDIPDLTLSNNLTVKNNASLGNGLLTVDVPTSMVKSNALNTFIESNTIKATAFKSNVLVTDANGYISKLYSLETTAPAVSYNPTTGDLLIQPLPTADKKILTSTYYNHLASLLNQTSSFIVANYWRKNQYSTGEIPGINVNLLLKATGTVEFSNTTGKHFAVDTISNVTTVTIGNNLTPNNASSTKILLATDKITFNKFLNKIIVTDNTGSILNQYFVVNGEVTITNNVITNGGVQYTVPLIALPNVGDETSAIPTWKYIKQLWVFASGLISWTQTNFWRKDQYNTGEIPNLKISNILKALGNISFGPENSPNISTNGTTTNIGKTNAPTNINGVIKTDYVNAVLATTPNGTVVGTYGIDETVITYTNPTAPAAADPYFIDTVRANFWLKNAQPQALNSYPNNDKKIPNSKYWAYLMTNIYIIKELLFDRPTYAELENLGGLPKGSVIAWTNTLGAVPAGFVICDGRIIPNTNIPTPNLINRFLKGSLSPNQLGGTAGSTVILSMANIPSHTHGISLGYSGSHSHYTVGIDGSTYGMGGGDPIKNQYSSGGNMGYDLKCTSSAATAGKTSTSPDHTHSAYISAAGSVSPTPINIEPSSYTVIYIMKYTGADTGVVVPETAKFSITNYDSASGALSFVKNHGTDTACTIEYLYPGATTWSSSTGGIVSPRIGGSYLDIGTQIRIGSPSTPGNYSTPYIVTSQAYPQPSTAPVSSLNVVSYNPTQRTLHFVTSGGNEGILILFTQPVDGYPVGINEINVSSRSLQKRFLGNANGGIGPGYPSGTQLYVWLASAYTPSRLSNTITITVP